MKAQDYPRPAVAVDLVIFTVLDADLKLLMVRRREDPFSGCWALPGGFVRVGAAADQGEDLDEAARRELTEETGLPARSVFLEQFHAFGRAGRDPRMRVISVAYYALVSPELAPFAVAGGDVAAVRWFSLSELPAAELAFDHAEIIAVAASRIRRSLDSTSIALELVPRSFSIAELRAVHEAIDGVTHDPANFRRRFLRMVADGLIEEAPGQRVTGKRRAKVYRFRRPRT
ncbi:MAG: NUDIX hydrolase [Candidatus Schekmanbacteria bacterium]|nr:NUDIX hydrolase [Candidatus Schekmanbacteria bacterium]